MVCVGLWLVYSPSEKYILWKLLSTAFASLQFYREQNKFIHRLVWQIPCQSGASRACLLTVEQLLAEEREWKLMCRQLTRKGILQQTWCSFLHLSFVKGLVFLRKCLVVLHKSLWYLWVDTAKLWSVIEVRVVYWAK